MPLYNNDKSNYINRRRLFIDSDERDSTSQSIWDGRYLLLDYHTNVQGMELINYNISKSIMPTFVEVSDSNEVTRGNNFVDIKLNSVGGGVLNFTVEFPPGRYDSIASLIADIPVIFAAQMEDESHGYYNVANGVTFDSFLLLIGANSSLFKTVCLKDGIEMLIDMTFLFGTGPNASNSAWNVFGFKEGIDNGGIQQLTTYGMPAGIEYSPIPDFNGSVFSVELRCPSNDCSVTIQ